MNDEYFSDIKKKARINMDIKTIKRIVLDNNLNDSNKLLDKKNKDNNEFNKKTIFQKFIHLQDNNSHDYINGILQNNSYDLINSKSNNYFGIKRIIKNISNKKCLTKSDKKKNKTPKTKRIHKN